MSQAVTETDARRRILETVRRRGILLELRYNHNHDPKTGRFISKAGLSPVQTDKTVNSVPCDNIKTAKGVEVKQEYLRRATPGEGTVTYEAGYDQELHSAEVTAAQWLRDNLGGDIVLLNEAKKSGVKTPDYLWKGRMWDLKTISTEKAANSAIRHGLQQIAGNPGGIILELGKRGFSMDVLKAVIDKRMGWCRIESDVDILIISNKELLGAFRY